MNQRITLAIALSLFVIPTVPTEAATLLFLAIANGQPLPTLP